LLFVALRAQTTMENAAYLDLNILDDMLKNLPLNNDVAHDPCILKVLV
jgi:hypothetical protein